MATTEARSIPNYSKGMAYAVAFGLFVATPLLGQSTAPTHAVDVPGVQEEAIQLARDGQILKGAEILMDAARTTTIPHAERTDLLVLAARLYHHGARADFARGSTLRDPPLAGRWIQQRPGRAALGGAYRAFESAAIQALKADQPVRAAHLLIDAAQVAEERGRVEDVRRLADQVGILLAESDLSDQEIAGVLGRVEYGPSALASASRRVRPVVPAS